MFDTVLSSYLHQLNFVRLNAKKLLQKQTDNALFS